MPLKSTFFILTTSNWLDLILELVCGTRKQLKET